MDKHISKISAEWIRETRKIFIRFLEETGFSNPERLGERGSVFRYPEWLIMCISVLSVKLKISTYTGIYKIVVQYLDVIAEGLDLKPVSERQLRDRLKKICHYPGKPAAFIFQLFPETDRAECFQRR